MSKKFGEFFQGFDQLTRSPNITLVLFTYFSKLCTILVNVANGGLVTSSLNCVRLNYDDSLWVSARSLLLVWGARFRIAIGTGRHGQIY